MGVYAKSPLDTDSYKFSMQNGYCLHYPNVKARFSLYNRGNHKFPESFGKELRYIVDHVFPDLRVTKDHTDFFREKCYYLSPVYRDFFKGFRFDPKEVHIKQQDEDLDVYAEGYLYRVTMWETFLMQTISELGYEMRKVEPLPRYEREKINKEKFLALAAIFALVSEFGTRRRFSYQNQLEVLDDAIKYLGDYLTGTSNCEFAMQKDLKPIGTQGHEWYMVAAALFGYRIANKIALEKWVDTYNGQLGIALPDTYTTKVFLQHFDSLYARLFDGGRQDSESPFKFTDMWVDNYKKYKIDPKSKIIVFSDSIKNVERVTDIKEYCKNKIKDGYGIGTWFTNDVGADPYNIVVKLSHVLINGNWRPAVKISDDVGKNTGESYEVSHCKRDLNIIEQ